MSGICWRPGATQLPSAVGRDVPVFDLFFFICLHLFRRSFNWISNQAKFFDALERECVRDEVYRSQDNYRRYPV
ncbi:MAG: hypothetical protein HPY61_00505 [Methanotrichaceae archaeon]|nr:hypothetical protein [Methanotrichaceae archaeon]